MKLPSLQAWSTATVETKQDQTAVTLEIQSKEPVSFAPMNTSVAGPKLTNEDCLNIAKAFLRREKNKAFHADRFVCPYGDRPRWINAHVCQWHRSNHDPECIRVGCQRIIDPNEKKRREERQVSKQSSLVGNNQCSLLFEIDSIKDADMD